MTKIAVIGSNSFSGSDFIDHLLEDPSYTVLGISRSPEKSSTFLPYRRKEQPHYSFLQADFNKDIDAIEQALDEMQPEYVVNFAAQSEVGPSWEHPDHWFETNAVGITKLANMLKDKSYLKKYVHISSPEVYGSCDGFITEDTPVNPSTPYAASKAAGDMSLYTFYKNCGLPLVLVRATNVYGSHQQLFKIIPRSIIYALTGKKISLHGGGVAVKSYIHIRDISKGEQLIMEQGRLGEIYHLSPTKGVSVRSVVETICEKVGVPFEEIVEVAPERLGQDKAYTIDSTKARKELGWEPTISLSDGIDEAVQWIRSNLDEIIAQPLEYVHKV